MHYKRGSGIRFKKIKSHKTAVLFIGYKKFVGISKMVNIRRFRLQYGNFDNNNKKLCFEALTIARSNNLALPAIY